MMMPSTALDEHWRKVETKAVLMSSVRKILYMPCCVDQRRNLVDSNFIINKAVYEELQVLTSWMMDVG